MSTFRKFKLYFLLSLPFAIIIFMVASTNTIYVLGGLLVYLLTLLFIILVSFITDAKMQTNFSHIAIILFTTSFISTLLGMCTYSYQESLNFERANEFVAELELYKSVHGHYPKTDTDIEIPIARYGLYTSSFEYIVPHVAKDTYIIKYFDGFWDTKVYVESSKKWFTDD